jgi:hypothetical protein
MPRSPIGTRDYVELNIIMSIDGLMPPDSVKMAVMISDFSA